MSAFKAVAYINGELHLIDQRALPIEKLMIRCKTLEAVVFAIKDMIVRGAPAIGATAAYGMLIGAKEAGSDLTLSKLLEIKAVLDASRPTAVNLMWATQRVFQKLETSGSSDVRQMIELIEAEAHAIFNEDAQHCKAMAEFGNTLIEVGDTILTHCNTGALATVAYGTALGVIREAHATGKNIHVYADETRPRLQGAKLTAWELMEEGIPSTLIPDSVAATLIRDGKIDKIIVGADRIASNGDTANKIGTFMLSALAKVYGVPFYVAAPTTTFDFDMASGDLIEIEERDATEVTHVGDVRIAPIGMAVYNPAFDVTPNDNITAIITEKGIVMPPFTVNIAKLRG
jgi:methylthioribose-1-phosphate isomerase